MLLIIRLVTLAPALNFFIAVNVCSVSNVTLPPTPPTLPETAAHVPSALRYNEVEPVAFGNEVTPSIVIPEGEKFTTSFVFGADLVKPYTLEDLEK